MADVRLTATNPEDSSVVPVACDASGRLLLEEPVQGPAGEQGPPGPQGDPGQDGDPFSGNFAGDVTFGGSAIFAGIVDIGAGWDAGVSNTGGNRLDSGSIYSQVPSTVGDNLAIYTAVKGTDQIVQFKADGSAAFGSRADTGDWNISPINGIRYNSGSNETVKLLPEGSALFSSDVVVGSRNKQWMLVEQGGLCHMVEQVRAGTADLVAPAAEREYPELRDVIGELNIVEKALEEVMVKLRMQVPAGWPVWDGSDEISTLPRKTS